MRAALICFQVFHINFLYYACYYKLSYSFIYYLK